MAFSQSWDEGKIGKWILFLGVEGKWIEDQISTFHEFTPDRKRKATKPWAAEAGYANKLEGIWVHLSVACLQT